MKKIISFFIILFFIVNFVTQIFALQPKSVSIFDFDNFAISQIQNTLSTSLSTQASKQNNTQQDNFFSLIELDKNIQNICFESTKSDSLKSIIKVINLNNLYRYKLFEFDKFINIGLTQYKMILNSYIAIVLSLIDNLKIKNIYKGKHTNTMFAFFIWR